MMCLRVSVIFRRERETEREREREGGEGDCYAVRYSKNISNLIDVLSQSLPLQQVTHCLTLCLCAYTAIACLCVSVAAVSQLTFEYL